MPANIKIAQHGLAIFAVTLFAQLTCWSQETYPWVPSQIPQEELRETYGTIGDQISADEASELLLNLTNTSRMDAGLITLHASDAANLLAQRHSTEMASENYLNHHNLAGLKCEQRFNELHQTDFVTENIAYYEVQHQVFLTPQLVKRIHQHWLQSENHRENIQHPAHTQMGSSVQVVRREESTIIAAVVNFVANYGDYDRLPLSAVRGDTLNLSGYIQPGTAEFAFVGIGYEELPEPRTVEYQLAHMEPYNQPEFEIVILPDGASPQHNFPSNPYVKYTAEIEPFDGSFTAEIRLPRHWQKSAVYITVWAEAPDVQNAPFSVMTQVVLTE